MAVPFDSAVRQVCKDCNNGWMSALEAKALVPQMTQDTAPHWMNVTNFS